jgi:1-acyl-sn-glycerol-3-phosphate acyltransferase
MRGALDRAIAAVARLAVRWFFRSVEIEGFDRVPRDRPILLVANHFNGLVDPLLVVAGFRRLPRFMAKATLWNVVPARPFLRLAGLVPVYRSRDGDTGGNAASFARVLDELRTGGVVALFPEGTTHDEPRLAELRTGAARIAALAWEGVAPDLVILPVGITYEDKVALRSRALVRAGQPIPRGDLGRAVTIDDHEAVRALTDHIGAALAALAPDFESIMQAGALGRAAEIAERDGSSGQVALADRERVARQLARLPDAQQQQLIDRVGRYQLVLDLTHVSDRAVARRPTARALLWELIRLAVALVVLAPFAIAGLVINTVPALLVSLAGRTVTEPVTKGTVRVLVALVVFPATWLTLALFDVGGGLLADPVRSVTLPLSPLLDVVFDSRSGFWPSVLVFVACPLFGLATIWVLERLGRLAELWFDWRAVVDRRGQLDAVVRLREEVVEVTRAPPAGRSGGTGSPAAPVAST